jgi:hypothetical protein
VGITMPLTKLIIKNLIAIIGTIIAFFAAIYAVWGKELTPLFISTCSQFQSVLFCVSWHYVLLIALIVSGVLLIVFLIPIAVDLIITFARWIIKTTPTIILWLKTPKPRKLKITWIQKDNSVLLQLLNNEWRYKYVDTLTSIQYVSPANGIGNKDLNKYGLFPEGVIEFKYYYFSNTILPIKKYKKENFEILKIDNEKDEFFIQVDTLNRIGFETGSYLYNLNIWITAPKKLTAIKSCGLIITYDGNSKINIEIREEAWK